MRFLKKTLNMLLRPIARARAIRRDDGGQVVVLTGVMVFLVMIMTIITFDTGQAIYNRIVAQNAADSAAASAALWQARGCNLIQHLNNLHYEVNKIIFIAETSMFASCWLAPGLLALKDIITIGPYYAACWWCKASPYAEQGQEKFAKAVNAAQKLASSSFPYLAFGYGNACAAGCGADPLGGVAGEYANGLLIKAGIDIPVFEDLSGAISGGLSQIPVYAAPLDPSSLGLYMKKKKGTGLPWKFREDVAKIGAIAGATFCRKFRYNRAGTWGWEDAYYYGNPGFMTWVAGKQGEDELLGLGNLRWLVTRREESDSAMDELSRRMYTGESTGGGPVLRIPPFMAIASSQVEGDPVVAHAKANAKPKLITVHFPPEKKPTRGDKWLILH